MTKYEKIKSLNKEEMARLIWRLTNGIETVPMKYNCNAITPLECYKRNCFGCYYFYLDSEVK